MRQLGHAHTTLAIAKDGRLVKVEWAATDMSAFESCTPQPGFDSLDNQIVLQLPDRALA